MAKGARRGHDGMKAYKGHPRSEWPEIKARLAAEKAALTDITRPVGSMDPADDVHEASQAEKFMAQVRQPKKVPDKNFGVPRETSNVDMTVPVVQPSDRVRKPNLFSGKIQKLVLVGKNGNLDDPIPGYRTHWFVDKDNSGVRINQAKASGWEFINKDEVELNDGLTPGNNDLGSHVRQIAGSENGNPFYMYAMKKPLWLEKEHQNEYAEKAINPVKDALIRGKMPGARPEDRQYAAGDQVALTTRSGLPPISIGTKTYR